MRIFGTTLQKCIKPVNNINVDFDWNYCVWCMVRFKKVFRKQEGIEEEVLIVLVVEGVVAIKSTSPSRPYTHKKKNFFSSRPFVVTKVAQLSTHRQHKKENMSLRHRDV